jgi:hypothetical protein
MALVTDGVVGSRAAYAEMYIAAPENMSLVGVSDMLHLQPRGKGDSICRPSGRRDKTAEVSYWVLSTRNMTESEDMVVHLGCLLDRLMPLKDEIISLQKLPDVSMRIRCIWGSKKADTGVYFLTEHIKKWAELNMDFTFELYSDSDEIIKEGTGFYGR